jgi:hypothetical protein
MKYVSIDYCLRCQSNKIFKEYPIVQCRDCKAIISIENNRQDQLDEIRSIKFHTSFCHVCIMCLDDKTYVDGRLAINLSLPFDVSEDKLKTYLTFS